VTKKPYDWDRPSDDLGLDIDYRAQWHAPIDTVERAFWHGVVIGAAAEAGVILGVFAFIWWM
jgi:hypothetical protein